MGTESFYLPGRKLLRWCEKAGTPPPNHPAAIVATPLLIGLVGLWLKFDANIYSVVAVVVVLLFQALILYLNGAAAAVAHELRQGVWEQIKQLNSNVTGNLGLLIEVFSKRHRELAGKRTQKAQYLQELRDLQQHLLKHAVDVICIQLGLDTQTCKLSANWCLHGSGENQEAFRAVLYNRNLVTRRPDDTDWKPIAENRPGASQAFIEATVTLVPDTRAPEFQDIFSVDVPYRSILSVPVIARSRVLGVMNIDASEPNILEISHQHLVMDVAYLVGLCELLRQENG